MRYYDRAPARLRAMGVADQLHRELRLDTSRAIDVFGVIEGLGMWLGFKKLQNLLGMYLTTGSGGVMLTTERDVSVQRYTAAHEIGHWALDSGELNAFDDEQAVHGVDPTEREFLAQIFAAYFLMPPTAVFASMRRLGIANNGITPASAYALSRELGASYEATIRHLRRLDVVDQAQEREVLGVTRLSAMTRLARGMRPKDGRAEVWTVDEHWHQQEIELTTNDQVVISLPERPSTGARWLSSEALASRSKESRSEPSSLTDGEGVSPSVPSVKTAPATRSRRATTRIVAELESRFAGLTGDLPALAVTDTRYEVSPGQTDAQVLEARRALTSPQASAKPLGGVGSVGQRHVAITAQRPGDNVIELLYARPFGEGQPLGGFSLVAHVHNKRLDFNRERLLELGDLAEPDGSTA